MSIFGIISWGPKGNPLESLPSTPNPEPTANPTSNPEIPTGTPEPTAPAPTNSEPKVTSEPTPEPQANPEAKATPAPKPKTTKKSNAQLHQEMLQFINMLSSVSLQDVLSGKVNMNQAESPQEPMTHLDKYLDNSFWNRSDEELMEALRNIPVSDKRDLCLHVEMLQKLLKMAVNADAVAAVEYLTSGTDFWCIPMTTLVQGRLFEHAVARHCNKVAAHLLIHSQMPEFQADYKNDTQDDILTTALIHYNTDFLVQHLLPRVSNEALTTVKPPRTYPFALLAVKCENLAVLRVLLERGVDFSQVYLHQSNAYQWAAYYGNHRALSLMCGDKPSEWFNQPQADGLYLLEDSIAEGQVECALWLMTRGARLDLHPRIFHRAFDSPQFLGVMAAALAVDPTLGDRMMSELLQDRLSWHMSLRDTIWCLDKDKKFGPLLEKMRQSIVNLQ